MKEIPRYRITLDAFGARPKTLLSCIDFIMTLCQTIGVNVRAFQAYEVKDIDNPDIEPGISISIIFLESSMSLHTWTAKEQASLDVFSCKPFKRNPIIKIFRMYFKPAIKTEITINFPLKSCEQIEEGPWVEKKI